MKFTCAQSHLSLVYVLYADQKQVIGPGVFSGFPPTIPWLVVVVEVEWIGGISLGGLSVEGDIYMGGVSTRSGNQAFADRETDGHARQAHEREHPAFLLG